MQFINEYKNKGGTVTVGDDAGYIYNLYGFGYIQEMELLREAGFSPLEVIHSATQQGARVLGHEEQLGTIRIGRKADLVIVKGNPIANMKLLFPTGTLQLNDATGKTERVGGIDYTSRTASSTTTACCGRRYATWSTSRRPSAACSPASCRSRQPI
jgi:adenine deaminase